MESILYRCEPYLVVERLYATALLCIAEFSPQLFLEYASIFNKFQTIEKIRKFSIVFYFFVCYNASSSKDIALQRVTNLKIRFIN